MKNIVLISVYFGEFPSYFNLWLKSAQKNSNIDFFIYGDCDTSKYEPLPENVFCFNISFEKMKEKIQSKFDFPITLPTPYKLCDYKPIYGFLFEDEIEDYKYWGHIDIDTILGDLTKFLPEKEYQKIYEFGHLCIYRNTRENNRRFMEKAGQDYRKVFTTSFITVFDELPGMYKKFKLLNIDQYCSRDFADIARRRKNFTLNNEICRKNYKYQIFYYDNGRVFRDYYSDKMIKTDEFNYIHFSHRKMPDKTNGKNAFYITEHGFIEKTSNTSLQTIKELNAPTPLQNIYYTINTQIIRRLIRIFKYFKSIIEN